MKGKKQGNLLLSNSATRTGLKLVALALTILIPFFCCVFFVPDKYYVLIFILTAVISIGESILWFILHVQFAVKPLKQIVKGSASIGKGEFIALDLPLIDKDYKDLVRNLNRTVYEFEEVEQMRKTFVSNASHELRSPLTSIQGFINAVVDGTVGEEERDKYLKIALKETKRLGTLINSMLDLSRMDSGINPAKRERFDINSIIIGVSERFQPNLLKKEIKLDIGFVRDVCYVYADKDKIVRVLINLIDNAIKYSPVGKGIFIKTHIHGKKVLVSIKDQGYGISKKDQSLIWERFYMADKARTPNKSKGTGLGLSIVKSIIEEHKEGIWVSSAIGDGTMFTFSLTLHNPLGK